VKKVSIAIIVIVVLLALAISANVFSKVPSSPVPSDAALLVASSTNIVAPTANAPFPDSLYQRAVLTIAGKEFVALVSDSDRFREEGLSGRSGLKPGEAMLFIFDTPDFLGFWMKDMRFSIDMLWLDADKRVVSSEKDVSPATYPQIFYPTTLAQYVVELPAGTLASLGVRSGDVVSISVAETLSM